MSATGDLNAEVRALVELEGRSESDRPAAVGQMQRLCRAAASTLPASGVGISLISETGTQVTVAASGDPTERMEELQFSLGEGPCLEAYRIRQPVLIPDLTGIVSDRWPGYAEAASDFGARAIFAFPLQTGMARLGAMDVYRDEPGNLSTPAMRFALSFAEVATAYILDAQLQPTSREGVLRDAVDNRYEVYQAQGIVMVQLGVSLAEAMVRIRGHAYANNRRVGDIADDILAGRLTFEPDAP